MAYLPDYFLVGMLISSDGFKAPPVETQQRTVAHANLFRPVILTRIDTSPDGGRLRSLKTAIISGKRGRKRPFSPRVRHRDRPSSPPNPVKHRPVSGKRIPPAPIYENLVPFSTTISGAATGSGIHIVAPARCRQPRGRQQDLAAGHQRSRSTGSCCRASPPVPPAAISLLPRLTTMVPKT